LIRKSEKEIINTPPGAFRATPLINAGGKRGRKIQEKFMKVIVKRKNPNEAIPVVIGTEFIKLESAMKLANIVPTGGSAKHEIQEGYVAVNGEICTMRGKKLYPGDTFTFEGDTYLITIHAAQ
jgi:ribosome-associated protein